MSTTTDETHDLVWGVPAIWAVINKPERGTYHMLERGDLPARKVRGDVSRHDGKCWLPLLATRCRRDPR